MLQFRDTDLYKSGDFFLDPFCIRLKVTIDFDVCVYLFVCVILYKLDKVLLLAHS